MRSLVDKKVNFIYNFYNQKQTIVYSQINNNYQFIIIFERNEL